jgi:hypothetical protein
MDPTINDGSEDGKARATFTDLPCREPYTRLMCSFYAVISCAEHFHSICINSFLLTAFWIPLLLPFES